MPAHSNVLYPSVVVVDIIYCGVIVMQVNPDSTIRYFAIEKFPQNPKQNTMPIDDATAAMTEYPDRSNVDSDKALAYWVANITQNADGTRKGGAFAKANFSLNGIPIGAELEIEVVKHNPHNTEVMVTYGSAEPFKAFAVDRPSPQYAVDTYIMCEFDGKLMLRVIMRAAAGPDYPNGRAIIGGFLDDAKTVAQGRANELKEEGGILIGDNHVWVIELGERNDHGREPRYMPFTYVDDDGQIITFGCERGSTANAVIHFVINKDDILPFLAFGTDTKEVINGEWVPLRDFLTYSNDPTAEKYVPWMDHQKGARDAAKLLVEMGHISAHSF